MDVDYQDKKGLEKLQAIIRALRAPDGCPWDRRQTKKDMGKYLLDEAYEVLDALDQESAAHLKEELGDLLFQILFIAHLAEEAGEFNMMNVMDDIAAKMIRRHPHVFGSVKVDSVEDVKVNWEDIKRNIEKKPATPTGILGKIPRSWPALVKAQRITEKASELRFDWDNIDGVFAKVDEELHELRSAVEKGRQQDIAEELGDVLFTIVNLCRFGGVDAEGALNGAVGKFTRRFHHMEQRLARQKKSLSDISVEEMDVLWNEAKKTEGKDL